MPINFANVTDTDLILIEGIVARAAQLAWTQGQQLDNRLSLMMDIAACHINGCPLKLAALLATDDTNFAHDVWGIRRHMNRKTGQLGDCFLPRFADLQED